MYTYMQGPTGLVGDKGDNGTVGLDGPIVSVILSSVIVITTSLFHQGMDGPAGPQGFPGVMGQMGVPGIKVCDA